MTSPWVGAISAISGALIGASVAIVQKVIDYKERKETRAESLLLKALEYLPGSELERSIGISILEGLYAQDKPNYPITIPAITSQAVYLLLHSPNRSSRTDFHNWIRLMDLLPDSNWLDNHYFTCYGEITNAFMIKIEKDYNEGIDMNEETILIWAKKYGFDLGDEVAPKKTIEYETSK